MYKRIVLGALTLILACVALYFVFKLKNDTVEPSSTYHGKLFAQSIAYKDLDDMNSQVEDGSYLYILTNDSADTVYLIDSILFPLSNEYKPSPLPTMFSVDMSDVGASAVTRLKKDIGVESFPALVAADIVSGKYTIRSVLRFDSSSTSLKDVRAWLFSQNLWNAPYLEN